MAQFRVPFFGPCFGTAPGAQTFRPRAFFWARMLNVVMQACRDDWHARANYFQLRRGMQRARANSDGVREKSSTKV